MKRNEIKEIFPDSTDEQLDKVLSINGKDVEKLKGELDELKTKTAELEKSKAQLLGDFEKLKNDNATAEDWKKKFEDLKNEIDLKEKEAAEQRKKDEKAKALRDRYEKVKDGREFQHPAIEAEYFSKFCEALENADNASKSDGEIFIDLTKNDATAFKVVQAKLHGGSRPIRENITKEEFQKMGYRERLAIYNQNPALYEKLNT